MLEVLISTSKWQTLALTNTPHTCHSPSRTTANTPSSVTDTSHSLPTRNTIIRPLQKVQQISCYVITVITKVGHWTLSRATPIQLPYWYIRSTNPSSMQNYFAAADPDQVQLFTVSLSNTGEWYAYVAWTDPEDSCRLRLPEFLDIQYFLTLVLFTFCTCCILRCLVYMVVSCVVYIVVVVCIVVFLCVLL